MINLKPQYSCQIVQSVAVKIRINVKYFCSLKKSSSFAALINNFKLTEMKNCILVCTTIMIFALSSCSKERDCTCTYNNGTEDITVVTQIESSKSKAEDTCDAAEVAWKIVDPNASCTLN